MTELNKQEGVEKLAAAVAQIKDAIELAKAIADEYALQFSLYPAYGMGGSYEGKGTIHWDYQDDGEGGEDGVKLVREYGERYPSSQSC